MSFIVSRSSGFVRAAAAAARVGGRWLLLLAAMATVPLSSAAAADLYYDVDPLTAAIDGGTANWSDSNWKATQAGTSGGTWTANDTAIFDPIVGSPTTTTITLGGTETATAVTFNGAGYTLTGGTLSLAGTGATNWINVNADGAIESTLTHMRFKGTGEMTISGGGTIATRGVVGDGGNNLVTVRQTGGNFTINEYFMVGGNNVANSDGAYIMDAGSLTISQGIYFGWNGSSGSFTQNGGFVTTQTANQGIQLGIGGGTGTYILNGGTLVSNFGQFGGPYSGTFTFGGGTFRAAVGFDTNRQTGVTTTIADGATARINTNGQNVTWSTELTGPSANGLVKGDAGTLSLNGNFTGDVLVTGGLLQARSATSLGTGTISATGTGTSSGAVDLNGFSFSNPIVLGSLSAGNSAAGVIQNTNTTTTSVLDGTVSVGGENYGGGNGSITFNGVVSGGVSNNYSLYKQGTGTWTFANENNTFDGFYYQSGGTTAVTKLANLNEPSSLGQPTTTAMNEVRFGFNGSGGGTIQYIGSSASTSDRAFLLLGATAADDSRIDADGTSAAATLTLSGSLSAGRSGGYTVALGGDNAGVNTYSGGISNGSGTVGLLKDGSTTWSLTGGNTYSGPTSISAGTLALGSSGSLATSAIDIAAGAALDVSAVTGFTLASGQQLSGAGSILGDLTFGSGSTLAFSETNTLAVSGGTVSFAAGFGISNLVGLDGTLVSEGTYTLISGTVDLTGMNNVGIANRASIGGGKEAYFSGASLNVVVVPEPGVWALGAAAAAGIIAVRCRRTKNQC